MRRSIRIGFATLLLLFVVYASWYLYQFIKPMVIPSEEAAYFYIPSSSKYEDLLYLVQQEPLYLRKDMFDRVAGVIGLNDATLKPGRYKIPDTLSYLSFSRLLKRGIQAPVNVVLTNERTLEFVAGKVDRYLEPDSLDLLQTFLSDEIISDYGYNEQTLMCMFIPNTYQFMWNTTPEQFLKRMNREWETFWNQDERFEKASQKSLTPQEVYILASIVERESQIKSERPVIAGLYLNRLNVGMKLQADPTVVFAIGDFNIHRILLSHLTFDSPYNTYLYEGLPPGPICMASINSIDAVLNAEYHNYVYMCAAPDNSGKHVFAETYNEHIRNANAYRAWLDKMNIK